MKKLYILMLISLVLTGCASAGRGIDTSSNCKYDVNGLSCKREQVWQMRDRSGEVFKHKHTYIWFEDREDCEDFLYDRDNKELIASSESGKLKWCGVDGKGETSADVANYYIYSDNRTDGNFYYKITAPLFIIDKDSISDINPYGDGEGFYAVFTSKSALEEFQYNFQRDVSTVAGYSTNHVIRVKIKRMY